MGKTKEYIISRMFKGSTGLAHGILVTLGIGLLLDSIGNLLGIPSLIEVGTVTKTLMTPAIGVGIAYALGANSLTIFSSMAASTIGAAAMTITTNELGKTMITMSPGEPIGAVLASILATFIGKKISGKTKLDMMLVPLAAVSIAGIFGIYISKVITPIITSGAIFITGATESSLLISSIVIAVVWGILIMSPASSVALALALGLNEYASAAALVGCSAQFVGFAIMSLKKNDLGGILALTICTPKIQLPNVIKKPIIMIPTIIASAISAPIAVILLNLRADTSIAGMGLCAFVAPINILSTQGPKTLFLGFVLGCVLLPTIITYIVYLLLKKKNIIEDKDFILPN